jgi:hypothetical protein
MDTIQRHDCKEYDHDLIVEHNQNTRVKTRFYPQLTQRNNGIQEECAFASIDVKSLNIKNSQVFSCRVCKKRSLEFGVCPNISVS